MRTALKLAYRNLIGAGLRTWLNVIVLSFSFVIIIWMKGILAGWDRQAKSDMISWEIGQGQYWHNKYDPYDPFTLQDSHAPIPDQFREEIMNGEMIPVLIAQGTLYPEGRMQPILIKGIPVHQELLALPTQKLDSSSDAIPAIIGKNMAEANRLEPGDQVVMRWRDANGTFDAAEITIVEIFTTNVPTVDMAQVWIPLEIMQNLLIMPDEASLFTYDNAKRDRNDTDIWKLMPMKTLVADLEDIIKNKSAGQSVFYGILLLLALLAVFDTQVLSIFRRQKEIGTYIALGYTRHQVVGLFTLEGAMHAVLAAFLAAVYGLPFLLWQAKAGWKLPMDSGDYGITVSSTLYPVYSVGLIVSTTLVVLLATAIVSYWPSRRIAKMNPTEALRGKLQ
jgi:putative ABC transport system permease protein